MSEKEKNIEIDETNQAENTEPITNEQGDDGTNETAASEEKLTQLNDQYLRLMAEYDNFKKRTAKEKIDIYTSAAADVIEAVLPVIDTMQRAMEMDSENEGLKLIKKQLEDALKAIGVEEISAAGQQFDPELHNAVAHVDDESVDNNTIVEEFAKGYKYKNKVIRHSMVKVAN